MNKFILLRVHKKQDGGYFNFLNLKKIIETNTVSSVAKLFEYCSIWTYFDILKYIRNKKGVFIVNQSFLAFLLYVFSDNRIIFIIDSIDNNYPKAVLNRIKSFVVEKLNLFLILKQKRIKTICETYYLQQKVYDLIGIECTVLHTPYPDARERNHALGNKITLAYVGRISEEKGIDHVIDFFSHLIQEKFICNILIIGDGPEIDSLKKISHASSVKILGHIERDELLNLYNTIDIMVHFPKKDAFPTVLRESLCFGIPVLSLKQQGVPEIIDNYKQGILLDQYDYNDARKMLDVLIEDYSTFSSECQNKCRNNCFGKYVQRFLAILEDF